MCSEVHRYIQLVFSVHYPPPPHTHTHTLQVNMNYQDQLETQRTDSKNAVEEYVYSMREKLESSLSDFISESDKESFRSLLSSTEDWLYEEGEVSHQTRLLFNERGINHLHVVTA